MTIFEHNIRARIFNTAQHPLKHSISDFAYAHDALPGVSTLNGALNWIFTVLYPRSQDSVATPGDLPAVGNTIGDYRVVLDDGDAKAAGYQWQQREGDATAKWYKISDMDWGVPTILSEFLLKTQDVYVYRYGYDDLDYLGAPITGTLAGQRIYGGASASTNLTLSANSGDGVGADTGYVQTTDHMRPTVNGTLDVGTTALKFRTGYFGTSVLAGTLTLAAGSVTDSSGSISFDNENLSTTGTLASGTHTVGNMVFATGTITNTGGSISFDNENLSTTGTLASGTHTIGTLVLAAGSITDTGGSISFDNENLSTTGTLGAGAITGTQVNVDNLRLDGNTLSSTSGALNLSATTVVDIQSAMTTIGQTVTGTLGVTGQLNADNLRLDANTLSSTNADGVITLSPNGTGTIQATSILSPSTDNARTLGTAALRWSTVFLSTAIGDGTTTIASSVIQSLRDINVGVASGMTIFWTGSKWEASLPDTEVDHGSLSGLSDDDHTQYALLAGRGTGQTLVGGTAASNNLTFESTSHGTKGKVLTKDTFAANSDASFSGSWSGADLGGSGNRFRHVYTAGEFFGLRLENLGADPSPSAQNPGRIYWQTAGVYLGVDDGTNAKRLTQYRFESDTSWNGSDTTKDVTVSSSTATAPITDARKALWQLKNNSADFETMYVSCKATSASVVRITVNVALPAGSYRLVGIQ
jgi:hypothetical protein